MAVARRLGDVPTLGEAVEAVWMADRDPAKVAERRALADELAAIAAAIGDPVLEFRAGFVQFLTASEQGDRSTVDDAVERCNRLAEGLGQPLVRWRAAFLRTHRAFLAGQLEEAERNAQEALRFGRLAGQPDAAGFSDVYLIRILQGRADEAMEMLSQFGESFGAVAVFPALRAWAAAEAGRVSEAEAFIAEARAGMSDGRHQNYLWLVTLGCLARAATRLGDALICGDLYPVLQPHRSAIAIGQAVWFGPVAYDLGLLATTLGRYAEAEEYFAEAVAIHARVAARGMLPHSYLAWGRMLIARAAPGDVARAREILGQAQVTGRDVGLANVDTEAARLLAGIHGR